MALHYSRISSENFEDYKFVAFYVLSATEADMVRLPVWVSHFSRTSCQGVGLTVLMDVVFFLCSCAVGFIHL